MLYRILSLLCGYLCGCILTAEIVSYAKTRRSIRTMGTGNPGMTNALRIFGKKYGLLVLAGDLGKTILGCMLAAALFPLPGRLSVLYAGFGAVLGHNLPFWNGFHGGKGVACTCMALFLFSPGWGLAACVAGLIVCLITRYLAIGAVVIPAAFFVFTLFLPYPVEVHIVALLSTLFMANRHFPALKNIAAGKEKKSLWWNKP